MIIPAFQHVCGTRARLISLVGLILLLHAGSVAAIAGSSTFAGVAFSPGSTVKANVPLSASGKVVGRSRRKRCAAECRGHARHSFEF